MKDKQEISVYIHIPFCIRKCNYCDFLSFPADEETKDRYVHALCQEIGQTGEWMEKTGDPFWPRDAVVKSIFFGGGTPCLLSGRQVGKILERIRIHFPVKKDAEISMEANPGAVSRENLLIYREEGINRLSLGLQSDDDRLLAILGRIHTYRDFLESYSIAREAGFSNINIDLMSAIPAQTLKAYEKTLQGICALGPEHISTYSLILEPGTPFYNNEEILRKLPDENTDREMYAMSGEILKGHGYDRYEISNYALPGKACVHNLAYWSDQSYLAFGLSASGYYKGKKEAGETGGEKGRGGEWGFRYSNTRDMDSYLKEPFVPFSDREEYIELSKTDRMEEWIFLGLRKRKGIMAGAFRDLFGTDLEEVYGKPLHKYRAMGLLSYDGHALKLTDAGIDVSNQIFADFLL